MDSIERLMKAVYPYWNCLTDEEKEIVNNIAIQIPISCENVAEIFILHGTLDKQKTIDYIYKQYRFIIE
jgi:hypothetical protein